MKYAILIDAGFAKTKLGSRSIKDLRPSLQQNSLDRRIGLDIAWKIQVINAFIANDQLKKQD